MDGIIKIIGAFAKLTLAILEGVLRAVFVSFFALILIGGVTVWGIVLSMYLLKYGCSLTSPEPHQAVGSAVVVAGWMVAVYIVVKTIRGYFFE